MELYLVMVALMLVAFLITYLTSRILSSKVLAMIRGNGDDRRRGHKGYSPNYRGKNVTFPGGLVFVAGCAIVVTVAVFGGFDETREFLGYLTSLFGFAFVGLVDDMFSDDNSGFKGHLGSLFRDDMMTTGTYKLFLGGTVALAASALLADGFLEVLMHTGIICLSANLSNLADTRPGRTAKFAMAFTFIALSLWIVLDRADVIINGFNSFFTLSVTLGGLLGTLHLELREQMMLGDTGSNAVGAVIGYSICLIPNTAVEVSMLVILAVLNVLSEKVSFTKVIEEVPVLRFIDELGRKR